MTTLEAQIHAAFPSQEPFTGSPTDDTCGCEEHERVRQDFGGKRWRDVPMPSLIEYHFDTLSLLSDAALHHFLPAFLVASIQPEAAGREGFVIQSLSMPWPKWYPPQYTDEQRSAVRALLADYGRRHPRERQDIAEAIEFWEQSSTPAPPTP